MEPRLNRDDDVTINAVNFGARTHLHSVVLMSMWTNSGRVILMHRYFQDRSKTARLKRVCGSFPVWA